MMPMRRQIWPAGQTADATWTVEESNAAAALAGDTSLGYPGTPNVDTTPKTSDSIGSGMTAAQQTQLFNTIGSALNTTGQTIVAIVNSNNQTEIARLQSQAALAIAQLQTAAQQAMAAGNIPLAQQQAAQAAALQQLNAQLAMRQQASSSNVMLIGIAVIGLLGIGALIVAATKKK